MKKNIFDKFQDWLVLQIEKFEKREDRDVLRRVPFWILFFFPYGIYLLLFKTKVNKLIKVLVTIAIAFFSIIGLDIALYPNRVYDNTCKESYNKFVLEHEDLKLREPLYASKTSDFKLGDKVYFAFNIYDSLDMYYGIFEINNYHKDYKDQVQKYYDRYLPYHIEGGDVLNLNDHIIAVGISQRTEPGAIDELAKNLFKDEECKVDTILAFNIPESRAFMHLDTVFTQIDYNKFTYHPGIIDTLEVFEITEGDIEDSTEDLTVRKISGSLEEILEKYLNRKIDLIPCAGGDKIAAEREQWNDGTNTLCIAPGVVVVYDRNNITNNILREHGLKVIEMSSAELSRGRGGPRCMSMPLIREDLK